jgi:hypothetical protein
MGLSFFRGKNMALFVANTTKQHHEFNFWVPEQRRFFTVKIQAGGQENIYPQGTRDVHEYIIAQHKVYGIKPVSEIDRAKGFVGLCYQFDKPISTDRLNETIERNDLSLNESARERRKEAALAMDAQLSEVARDTRNGLSNLEVEVIEEEKKGVDSQVNETIVVEKQGRRSRRAQ